MTRPISGEELSDLMRFDDLCARIYADNRMPPGTREIALAFAWVGLRDPDRPENGLRRTGRLLGRTNTGRWRHKLLIADDAPRYEDHRADRHNGSCDGPRFRPHPHYSHGDARDKVCGADGSTNVVEHDMATGQVRRVYWFCRRHLEHAERVLAQVAAAGEPPPPIPNRGGLLPCYFGGDWPAVYRWATGDRWEPPYYGICVDDWPTPGHDVVPRRPLLSVVVTTNAEVSA